MFPNRNWRRILMAAILIFVAVLVPTVVIPAAEDLIVMGIKSAGETIHEIIRPLSGSGEERLKGLVRLCLYLIFATTVLKFFFKN